ncbi:hypothetical protein niasHS_004611 [Heterodera schachtii]|uniref:BTB domain-containing protein n=1 Tax=Heterodera schachtii TaxID=97005 RepID=A0ABD2JRA7_HETSC
MLFGEAFGGGSSSKENKKINERHKTNALAQRMSKLLSTGAYGDVQFLVEEGDKKELLLAHKAILWHASEEFASILCVDAQSDSNEKKSAETIKTVLVIDVTIEAFKVMLSFIYTEDLKGLTAQNLLDVLFAAKKYKTIGLIDACVAFPISQLSNVFEVIAKARLLDMDFAQCCLQYIDQNAHDLFLSKNFLQIDNEFLTELLALDQLQTNGELEIWQAALRWADAQCRRNGTECSAKNRRVALGQALFEIRFPLIKKEDFSKIIESSGVLTSQEVISVYEFDPNIRGKKRKYPMKFPTHKRNEQQNEKWTFLHTKTKCFDAFYGQKNNSLAHRMKELLANGTFADVKFRIEEGEETKILPAHKAIIYVASDFFETLFRFETLKMDDSAEKASDQSLAIKEIPIKESSISAFNVLLQFIYADDFSGLNGENWSQVIYSAKMYEISGLVEACETFPISKLPNIFEAVDLAHLLNLEELKNHCLEYIDANMETLLRTNGFLQIDQHFLCEIFGRENPQINGDISLWNAALRWADAQCLRNGTECSGENRRALLGGAVEKIHFPLISKETFTEDIAPSGVLTPEEVISIYQFHAHPELIGVPGGLPPSPFALFPSREKAHRNNSWGTLRLEIGKFSEFKKEPIGSERLGEHMFIKGIPLQILAKVGGKNGDKYLGLFIKIKEPVAQGEWTLKCSPTFRILSQSFFSKNFERKYNDFILNKETTTKGANFYMDIGYLTSEGLYNKKEDKVKLSIDVNCDE